KVILEPLTDAATGLGGGFHRQWQTQHVVDAQQMEEHRNGKAVFRFQQWLQERETPMTLIALTTFNEEPPAARHHIAAFENRNGGQKGGTTLESTGSHRVTHGGILTNCHITGLMMFADVQLTCRTGQ